MAQNDIILLPGTVIEGHHVASGPSEAYPYGALEQQIPYFKLQGLDLDRFFKGTLNISIRPFLYKVIHPSYTFRQITWTDLHPPEDFSFSPCKIMFQGKPHEGYIYYPHPETKIRHFQNPSVIEVITDKIPGIRYGDQVELFFNPAEIQILKE
jgi:hypothetical protein